MAWVVDDRRTNRATGRRETYFAIAWRENGKVRTRGLGFCTTKEAKEALKVFEGKLAAGEPVTPPKAEPEPEPPPKPPVPTVREYVDGVWLPVVERERAPKTYTSACTSAKAVNAELGDLPVTEVDFDAIDGFVAERREQGRRSRTITLDLWLLRGALQHAVDCQVLSALPKFPRISLRDRRKHVFLSPEQSILVLDELRPFSVQPHEVTRGRPPIQRDHLSYLAVLIGLDEGFRKGEILSRGWEDIAWDLGSNGSIHVRAKPQIGFQVKTGRDRTVPMTTQVAAELRELHLSLGRPTRGWIFPSDTDPSMPRKDFGGALRRACERADVPVVHPHALRHTWATRMAMAGVDRATVMELGGWTDSTMLDEVYSHTTDAHKADVMARLGVSQVARIKGERRSSR